VLPVRYNRLDMGDHFVFLIAVDAGAFEKGAQDRPLARMLARHPGFTRPGTCLVSENFAALNRVGVGDRIQVPGPEGKQVPLEVLGTVVDYTWNRGTILVDRGWYKKEFADRQVDVLDVFLEKDADPEAMRKAIVDRWSDDEALVVANRAEVHQELRGALKKIYSMAYAQQAVVGMVALLGVVSALFISVLHRRRELGLLRAVGATRGQILRSVLAEAVLMGLIGASTGFLIGLVLEWYVLNVMLLDEAGFIFPFKVAWVEAGFVCFLAVVCATLAGLWPAYKATQLRIPDAIAYE
jgi:putative ABC transport system permease protein